MRTITIVTSLLSLLWALSTQANPVRAITVVAPKFWCPFSCEANTAREGFVIEIIKKAFKESNIEVIYSNMPYERSLLEVRAGRIDAVAPTFKAEAPDFIYPKQYVSINEYCFYTRFDSSWSYDGINSVKRISFVATSGYSYNRDIDEYIANNIGKTESVLLLKGHRITERMAGMVKYKRFNALLEDTGLIDFMRFTTNHGEDLIKAGCLEPTLRGYLALSPKQENKSTALSLTFDKGMKALKERGTIQLILNKYGINNRTSKKPLTTAP